jgi:hypothetical protein
MKAAEPLVDPWDADPTPQIRSVQGPPLPLEYDGEIRPWLERRYLIKGLLGAAAKIVVFGPPGCGKSFLAWDMARHISRGLDWFGRRTRSGRCVYLAAEGQAGLRTRHAAWNLHHPAADPDPFALIPTAVDLLDPRADLPKLRTTLDCFVGRFGGLELLIIDTLAATFGGGDENGSDMAAYVANIERLCAPYGCASLIVTHAPLDATAKRPRGHSSLWGAADAVLHVTGDRDAPARRLHVLKQKDDDPGPDLLFTLRSVEVGVDEDGDLVTSCVVEQSEYEPTSIIGKRRLSAKEAIVKAAIERALAAFGVFPPTEIPDSVLNRVRTNKVVRMADWRAEALPALVNPDTKPDTARRTFDRARETLQASEIIGVWEDWAWLNF